LSVHTKQAGIRWTEPSGKSPPRNGRPTAPAAPAYMAKVKAQAAEGMEPVAISISRLANRGRLLPAYP